MSVAELEVAIFFVPSKELGKMIDQLVTTANAVEK